MDLAFTKEETPRYLPLQRTKILFEVQSFGKVSRLDTHLDPRAPLPL